MITPLKEYELLKYRIIFHLSQLKFQELLKIKEYSYQINN